MTPTQRRPQPLRSIGAVVAGFLITAALSVVADLIFHALHLFPAWGTRMSDGAFAFAAAYRAAFTMLGGYATARLAPNRAQTHVRILAGLGLLAGTLAAISTWKAGPQYGPHWYPLALVIGAPLCVLFGGRLAERSRATAAHEAQRAA